MRFIILAALVLLPAGDAAAYTGKLLMFSDAAFTDSTLVDAGTRTVEIHVVEVDFVDANSVGFKIVADPGFTGVWLGDSSPWPNSFGTTPEGFWVVYGCIGDDVLVTTVTYQLYGTSAPCSRLRIVPPESYMPWVPCQTCNFVETACERVGTLSVNCTVPVQETTWGRVKALYR